MKKVSFEDKVKSMKFSEIMQTMITGLKYPRTKIDMQTYGKSEKGVCYGCAATNAILRLGNVKEITPLINTTAGRAELTNCESVYFLDCFESAIDSLRRGNLDWYLDYAHSIGIAKIPEKFIEDIRRLPILSTETYHEYLSAYQKVCTQIKKAGY